MRRTSNLSLLSLAALTSEPLSTPYPIGLDHCLPDPTTGASKVMEGALDFTSPSSLLLSTINRESRRAIAHHVYVHPISPGSLCSHIPIPSIIWLGKWLQMMEMRDGFPTVELLHRRKLFGEDKNSEMTERMKG